MNKFILGELQNNGKKYILFFCIILVGIIIGTVIANKIPKKDETILINETVTNVRTKNIDYKAVMEKYLKNDFTDIIIITFISFSIFYKYGNILFFLIKGMRLGFVISIIMEAIGIGKGIVFSIVTIMLPNLIKIPVLLYIFFLCINLLRIGMENQYESRINLAKNFVLKYLGSCILIIINCVLNTYVFTNILVLLKNML